MTLIENIHILESHSRPPEYLLILQRDVMHQSDTIMSKWLYQDSKLNNTIGCNLKRLEAQRNVCKGHFMARMG